VVGTEKITSGWRFTGQSSLRDGEEGALTGLPCLERHGYSHVVAYATENGRNSLRKPADVVAMTGKTELTFRGPIVSARRANGAPGRVGLGLRPIHSPPLYIARPIAEGIK
jgi:hypothetical protein